MSSHRSGSFRHIIAFAFAAAILVAGAPSLRAHPGFETNTDIQVDAVSVFYDELAPYGQWYSTDEYGWIWIPSPRVVGADFVPYASNGQWVFTDKGWFFQSDFRWGWAPFHYGRWYFDTALGWVWVPGRVWAPAWVDWRVGAGFIGWSPRPPRRLYRAAAYPGHWYFVREGDFRRPRVRRYVLGRDQARRIYDRTSIVRHSRRVGDARLFRGPRVTARGAPSADTRPIRIVPPRRGVVGRVDITGRSGSVQEMRPRPRAQPRVARPAPRSAPMAGRRPSTGAQQPPQAVRGPVRARVPRQMGPSVQRRDHRRPQASRRTPPSRPR